MLYHIAVVVVSVFHCSRSPFTKPIRILVVKCLLNYTVSFVVDEFDRSFKDIRSKIPYYSAAMIFV